MTAIFGMGPLLDSDFTSFGIKQPIEAVVPVQAVNELTDVAGP
jgi:hypothetical protein